MVWVEDRSGTIVRGRADSVTESGLVVHLAERPPFESGDDVALRISFEPDAPTVATKARAVWIREGTSALDCGLEWNPTAEERAALDVWLAGAA
jgi:hypothetical protein